jgi:hypothetical protein
MTVQAGAKILVRLWNLELWLWQSRFLPLNKLTCKLQEEQDLYLLLEAAKHHQELLLLGRVEALEEAPVRVVVKSPHIAIRLPSAPTDVRFPSSWSVQL